jgi:hypothetical protein
MIPTSMAYLFLPSIEARSRAASAVNCHDERAQRSNLKRAVGDDNGVYGVALSRGVASSPESAAAWPTDCMTGLLESATTRNRFAPC